MSSPDFPTLHLDVSARRVEPALALAVLTISLLATFLLFRQSFATFAMAALCGTLTVGGAFRLFGWLGGARRLTRIVLLAALVAVAVGVGSGFLLHQPSGGLAVSATVIGLLLFAWSLRRLRFGPVLTWALRRTRSQLGLLIPLLPVAALIYVAVWLIALVVIRISSVAGMLAAISAPVAAAVLGAKDLFPMFLAFALLVLWRHRENIARLRAGTESRLGRKHG